MFEAKLQSFADPQDGRHGPERVAALRARLAALGLDGYLVPRADEHQGEYVPASDERLAWLTGFTGSAGAAVILSERAALFTDGRYTEQARAQTHAKTFERVQVPETTMGAWLADALREGAVIGYDPALHTPGDIERLEKSVAKAGATLRPVALNIIDSIWSDRPPPPAARIALHPAKYAGDSAAKKIARLKKALASERVDGLLVSDPHAVAWLFNIRGGDVAYTPLPLSYAYVPATGKPELFISPVKVPTGVAATLGKIATLRHPRELDGSLAATAPKARIRLDGASAGIRFKAAIEAAGGTADVGTDPIALMKAVKSPAEQDGAREAHLTDAVAMARFLCWFDSQPPATITEIDAVAALETFRREAGVRNLSFPTISGANANAALPHYRVTEKSNARITKGIFLIDSGGQYEAGTTDITRTIAVGPPTREMKDRYTRVLKGMIAISRAVFPKGTSGAQLDAFARASLWSAGLDFDHGTGHGVGSYLSVHEGPQRISKLGGTALEPGMILSNEPGYYKPGGFGIRIENLVLVTPAAIKGAEREMYGFETLTFAPIDTGLIDAGLMTSEETAWLNAYHKQVRARLSPLLDKPTARWLRAATAAI